MGMLGRKMSAETREKMSLSKKGKPSWNKGKKWSKDHKEKLSGVHLGKKLSKETRDKISKVHLARREQSHLWKGGISAANKTFRQNIMGLVNYKYWRKQVFERDDFTCQDCGVRGVILHADHIEAFAMILRRNGITDVQTALICTELWDIKNGRTLCVSCHRKTPTWGQRTSNALKKLLTNQTTV